VRYLRGKKKNQRRFIPGELIDPESYVDDYAWGDIQDQGRSYAHATRSGNLRDVYQEDWWRGLN
jgi:hypothetical protein